MNLKHKTTTFLFFLLLICGFVTPSSAVWIYPDVDIYAEDFTLNTKSAQNFSYLEIGTDYTNLSWGGDYFNISYTTNMSSSSASVQYNGSYTTNLTIDVFNLTASVDQINISVITNNSVTDATQTLLPYVGINATHRRYYYVYNPSDTLTAADLGLFDVNISCIMENGTLQYYGYEYFSDVFTVTSGSASKTEEPHPPINGTASETLVELNGYCGLGTTATNFTADVYTDVYAPSAWTVNYVYMHFLTASGHLDQNVTATSYTQVNSSYRRYSYVYNPSNTLSAADMGNFDVNVTVSAENSTNYYINYTYFNNVFAVYELQSISNVTSEYNATYHSINMSWDASSGESTTFRPNAAGDLAENTDIGDSPNYACVDEASADDDTTYVLQQQFGTWWDDLYNIPDHTTEEGDIQSVTVYGKCRGYSSRDSKAKLTIRANGTSYEGNSNDLAVSWSANPIYSYSWSTNPYTGEAWTWSDIDNLQIGTSLYEFARCTQLYLIVDYINESTLGYSTADSFVVVRNNASYATCPTDGYEVQNSTSLYYNVSLTFSEAYFTVFCYNDTTYSYSLYTPMPWGAVGMSCFNESNPTQAIDFDIEITNTQATEVYYNTSLSNIFYISIADIPYGTNTIFVVSNSSYKQRVYHKDLTQNNFYNYTFYLPPFYTPGGGGGGDTPEENETKLYLLEVEDEYNQPIEGVLITIQRYINTTDSYETIAELLTDANGGADVYLIPNTRIKAILSKTGYTTKYENFRPDPNWYGLNYPKTFKLELEEDIYPDTSIGDCIVLTGNIYTNNTIRTYYLDKCGETLTTNFTLYEVYNFSRTYIESWSETTDDLVVQWSTITNTSREHIVVLDLTHTTIGTVLNYTIYILPDRSNSPSENWINTQFSNAGISFGDFSVALFFIIWLPSIMVLVLFGAAKHPGLGIITASLWITFSNWYVDFNLVTTLTSIAAILLILGVIVIINKQGRRVTT